MQYFEKKVHWKDNDSPEMGQHKTQCFVAGTPFQRQQLIVDLRRVAQNHPQHLRNALEPRVPCSALRVTKHCQGKAQTSSISVYTAALGKLQIQWGTAPSWTRTEKREHHAASPRHPSDERDARMQWRSCNGKNMMKPRRPNGADTPRRRFERTC